MTDEHKPADYAELLSRAEKETHRSGMWADTCLLIDELAAAIRSLIGERDDLAIKLRLEQSSSTFAHIDDARAALARKGGMVMDLSYILATASFADPEARAECERRVTGERTAR